MFDAKVIQNNIKKFRSIKGLSQTDLAILLKISPQSVSKWERGKSLPDIENIFSMSKIFNISIDDLMGNTGERKKTMIGIDGGGTKTEFVMFDEDGNVLENIILGPSNPNVIGIEESAGILKKGINQLLYINPVVEGIYIGGSGFLTADNGKKIRKILKEEYRDVKIKCETDIHNVIASCTEEKRCIAVICGTGASVFSYDDGTITKFGGWGYLLDRKGSGFNIGKDAIYYSLRDAEGIGEKTIIKSLLEEKVNLTVDELIGEVYKNSPSYIASFAPLVFDAYNSGDKVAGKIIEENARELAEIINCASKQTRINNIILSGSVITGSKILRNYVEKYLNKNIKYIIPNHPQVYGACVLCARMCNIELRSLKYAEN